jgi:hypothetical protein
VDWAGRYGEYFKKDEFKSAHDLIAEGKARAAAFQKGETPCTRQTGLVVRGYKSKIDGSVQPYGMVIPDNYAGSLMRLDFWCHGRGETLTELAFLSDRRKNVGQLPATNRLVLHLYGRYCCANKMAGEVDLWEAYAHARKSYNIDDDRLFIRGFSMGGAAVWRVRRPLCGPLVRHQSRRRFLRDPRVPERLPERGRLQDPLLAEDPLGLV